MIGETEFVKKLKHNDPKAMDWLYDHYASSLYEVTLKLTGDKVVAASVLQQSFLLFWKNASSFDSTKEKLFPLILSITIAECNKVMHLSTDEVVSKLGLLASGSVSKGR
jgi:DNA-directed RNA polymerase specialized sigma24 family protein